MENCIFCKIANGEISSNKVYENDNILVILDIEPANPGHCLVIPKKHYSNIFEIEEDILKESFFIAKKIAYAIKESMNCFNINILQNNGEDAGQSVGHFHIHVIPREKGDKVTIHSEAVKINDEINEKIKEKISKNIK